VEDLQQMHMQWLTNNEPDPNPMVRKFGMDQQNRKCSDCDALVYLERGTRKVYKCKARSVSHSEASDHRLKWNACRRFIPEAAK
jgi:hypothetical protein